MCDLNQLELAIQEMSTNYEAAQFVKQVLDEDNIQFLRYITQIWLNPDIPDKVMTNSVTLISVALRPTILQPISVISEKYFCLSGEERDQIKKAIIRGLMHEHNKTRANFAYCLSIIVKIERAYETKTDKRYSLKPTIFDTYLMELLQNSQSQYGQIGAIMAITEILANDTVNLNSRQFKNVPRIILDVSYQVFDKLEDVDQIDIEFKSECARCINQAIKVEILSRNLSKTDEKQRFLQSLLPNTQIPDPDLHKNLLNALTRFICMLYDQYSQNFNEEAINSLVEQVYKETIQPISSVQADEFDLKETEPYAQDVMKMWIKFAKKEYKMNDRINEDYHINLISTIATTMDEYLFSFISTFQIEDIFENNSTDTISFFAYQCLQSFSRVAPDVVFAHSNHVYESYLQEESRQSVFVSFVAAQIIFQIDEIKEEILFKIINDLVKYTQSSDNAIASSAYAAIITACEYHPAICFDQSFFKCILQTLSSSLQSETSALVVRGLKMFQKLILPFRQTDEDSNLNECYQYVIQMLMDVAQRPDVNSDLKIEHAVYMAIYNFLARLPLSIPNSLVLTFGSQVYDQMQSLIDEHPDGGLQLRAWLSIIINGITEKVHSDIEPLAPGFLTVLASTCEEINSTNSNINSHEDVISAICTIVYNTGQLSQPLVPRLFDIALHGISTQDAFLTSSSSLLISHLFRNFKLDLIDSAGDILNALIDCLASENNNLSTNCYIYHAINSILNIGSDLEDSEEKAKLFQMLGENLLTRREELMNISVNFIPLFDNYAKDSKDNTKTIFSELLELFTYIMKAYDFEKKENPEDTDKLLPSDFIAYYQEPFIEIIETGSRLKLYDDEIGIIFCDYIEQIINSYGSSLQMNVKIHKPGFKNYFKWAMNSDEQSLRKKASIIKEHCYDKA